MGDLEPHGDHRPPKTDGWTPDFPDVGGAYSGDDQLRHPRTIRVGGSAGPERQELRSSSPLVRPSPVRVQAGCF